MNKVTFTLLSFSIEGSDSTRFPISLLIIKFIFAQLSPSQLDARVRVCVCVCVNYSLVCWPETLAGTSLQVLAGGLKNIPLPTKMVLTVCHSTVFGDLCP